MLPPVPRSSPCLHDHMESIPRAQHDHTTPTSGEFRCVPFLKAFQQVGVLPRFHMNRQHGLSPVVGHQSVVDLASYVGFAELSSFGA